MRLFYFFAFLGILATIVLAWEKEDHEIFDLVSEIQAAEGKGTTFYSWLDVPFTASTSEIARAYRKMSIQLHPDKNPGVKGAHERFARLGVVAAILRNTESRKRYDFFYKNGVPKWRGTGYYYSRFRPGLGAVLAFLAILSSVLQLVVQRMNYKRDVERIKRFMDDARTAAWGPKLIPCEGQRKVKVPIGASEDRASRFLEMVVEGSNVYLLEPSGDMHLLDVKSVAYPAFSNTWFFTLIKSFLRKITNIILHESKPKKEDEPQVDEDDNSSCPDSENWASASSGGKALKGLTAKTGGKRRKVAPRKR